MCSFLLKILWMNCFQTLNFGKKRKITIIWKEIHFACACKVSSGCLNLIAPLLPAMLGYIFTVNPRAFWNIRNFQKTELWRFILLTHSSLCREQRASSRLVTGNQLPVNQIKFNVTLMRKMSTNCKIKNR